MLDDARITPAHQFNDGQNYHPTNKWVLFGHHFAAISGAGPLIGPVLAIQYGYMPGLLWLVIGVCLAGAVQDMLVLAASVRRGGKSLAEIARTELGPWADVVVSVAILFIVIIALAGSASSSSRRSAARRSKLAGGNVNSRRVALAGGRRSANGNDKSYGAYTFPAGCRVRILARKRRGPRAPKSFQIRRAS